jgi:hypothetical protein
MTHFQPQTRNTYFGPNRHISAPAGPLRLNTHTTNHPGQPINPPPTAAVEGTMAAWGSGAVWQGYSGPWGPAGPWGPGPYGLGPGGPSVPYGPCGPYGPGPGGPGTWGGSYSEYHSFHNNGLPYFGPGFGPGYASYPLA